MEFGLSLMELVSPCSTAVNQGIKTMHPQGNSASLSQQSHMPQSLSNMHTNTSAAHNYSSQHPYSLNISSSSAGPFTNQNSDQAPASNHPVTNPVGQSYNLQKSNNQATPGPTSQAHSLAAVQPLGNVTPQVAEQPLSEKSQANGTSEGEPSQSFGQSGFALTSKDKPSVPVPAQAMDIEPSSIQEKVTETSSLPIPAKTENTESVTSSPTPETNVKPAQEVPTPKEADSPTSSSMFPAQPENKPATPSVAVSEKEKDPLRQPEKEKSGIPEQTGKSDPKIDPLKKDESKVENDLLKNVGTLNNDAAKLTPTVSESVKEDRPVQKTLPDAKTPVKTNIRKAKNVSSQEQELTPMGSSTPAVSSGISTAKRQRIRTQHYQSPIPELEFVSKISSTSLKNNDEKLIVFYKNEFLAVRNAEGGFYLCQALQNIYKSSPKIKIRWLSQDKSDEKAEVYTPDFYDTIDFDCILTNLSLNKADKGKFVLPPSEKTRTESILNRSLAVEKGEEISSPSLTEEHPDGLDLSLYRDEDQLKKRKARKRSRKTSLTVVPKEIPIKKSRKAPKARKLAPPAKQSTKKVAPKKSAQVSKKSSPSVPSKPLPSVAKSSKVSGKVNSKTSIKASTVVDQKKAKVLARIGRKTAVAAASKSAKNVSKNGKSGNKAVASSNKTVQSKASSNGSVKSTTRSVRKSTRK